MISAKNIFTFALLIIALPTLAMNDAILQNDSEKEAIKTAIDGALSNDSAIVNCAPLITRETAHLARSLIDQKFGKQHYYANDMWFELLKFCNKPFSVWKQNITAKVLLKTLCFMKYINVNYCDPRTGQTPLTYALTVLPEKRNDDTIVNFLLNLGALPNLSRPLDGRDPLILAIRFGNRAAVCALLMKKQLVDSDELERWLTSALMYAVRSSNKNKTIVTYLIRAGADMFVKSAQFDNMNAYELAIAECEAQRDSEGKILAAFIKAMFPRR